MTPLTQDIVHRERERGELIELQPVVFETSEKYDRIFTREAARQYPAIDAFELECGFSLDPVFLKDMARVLACPLKANPPCWQHGRVLYSVARRYLSDHAGSGPQFWLDIGTAKGFSALCMAWALAFGDAEGKIVSLDVIDPMSTVPRNSVAELDGPKTLVDFVQRFRPQGVWARTAGSRSTAARIDLRFFGVPSRQWLEHLDDGQRINLAFVDGKHNFDAVVADGKEISHRQHSGDVIVFDDMQIAAVRDAVEQVWLLGGYEQVIVEAHAERRYAIMTKI